MSKLQRGLAVRLLNKKTCTLNLTPTGQLIAKRSEQLLELLTIALDEINECIIAPAGRH
ncbi:MAG: hypothetical protein HRT53_07275 [Colwellia sp.]|nr:hypothetical protein [Colwellia sp.]